MNEIQGSHQLSRIARVKSVVKRSNRCLAVEAENEDGAALLKAEILRKYLVGLSITTPKLKKPMIKIAGCTVVDVLAEDIKYSNPSIIGSIVVVRHYDVGRGARMYRNVIIELSLEDRT